MCFSSCVKIQSCYKETKLCSKRSNGEGAEINLGGRGANSEEEQTSTLVDRSHGTHASARAKTVD